jgi:CheY-like chemotaxis protein
VTLPQIRDISVLVVDDEEDARVLIAKILTKAGADVRTSKSAAEALEATKAQAPDVLISDVRDAGRGWLRLNSRKSETTAE